MPQTPRVDDPAETTDGFLRTGRPACPPLGRYQVSATRDKDGYRFHVPGAGTVDVDAAGKLLHLSPFSETRRSLLQDAFTAHILPLLWTMRGGLTLHGAAIGTPAGAVVLFGPSGAGKSTLAASFAARSGCRVLDDDSALLEETPEGFRVHPTGRGLALWADSATAVGGEFPEHRRLEVYGSKYRVRHDDRPEDALWPSLGGPGSVPLVAAFHVPRAADEPSEPVLEAMQAGEKHLRLAQGVSRPDLADRQQLHRQFVAVARLIASVPISRLRFPRAYQALSGVQDLVLAEAAPTQ